jgi:hypothetical protein
MNNWYTYYKLDIGQIVSNMNCNAETAELNIPDQCGVLEGLYQPDRFYIDNQQPVQIPYPPNAYSEFDFTTHQWVTNTDRVWAAVRQKRNELLSESDWTDTASAPGRLGPVVYEQWQVYRQALRDVTTQPDPLHITWPTAPGQTPAPTTQIPVTSI